MERLGLGALAIVIKPAKVGDLTLAILMIDVHRGLTLRR